MGKELDNDIIDGSGNVFSDLGLPSSDEDILKFAIAKSISDTIQKKELTQVEAAKIMRVDQAKVSAIVRGRLNAFSVDRLIRLLIAIGRDIQIHISEGYTNEPGKIRVCG